MRTPRSRKRALLDNKIAFIKETQVRNKFRKNHDVVQIMTKKFNKHLNESLKKIEDHQV